MNIAYIVPALVNKGPVLVVKDLVDTMIAHGHQCTVFYFDEKTEITIRCSTVRIRFFEKINFSNFDIVHTHGIRPDLYAFLFKPMRCRTKLISTLHNYVIQDLSSQYNRLVGYVFGNLWMMLLCRHNKVVVLSKHAIEYYHTWFSYKKLAFVYNSRQINNLSLSSAELSELKAFKKNDFLIGANALLTKRKGIDLLIRALTYLPGYKLFIVGEGIEKNNLIKETEKYGFQDRVKFAGYKKDAYRYLSYYDVYAMPSRSEGFGLAHLEAAIIGVPVVVSDIAIFKEIYSENEVEFFHLEDIVSLADAIKRATGNFVKAKMLHRKYQECYSLEKFYEHYLKIYTSIL